MPYTLEELSRDIRQALTEESGAAGKERICALVSRAALDKEFLAKHVTAEQCKPRKVLYEDPSLGFCICGHVYDKAHTGGPHDHGIWQLPLDDHIDKFTVQVVRSLKSLPINANVAVVNSSVVSSLLLLHALQKAGRGRMLQ